MNTPILKRDRGVALIIVLSFVVLAAAVVVAFLSRAQLNQKISAVSTGGNQADSIARGAIDVIVGDLTNEIRAGSNGTTTPYVLSSEAARYPQRNIPALVTAAQSEDGDPIPSLLKVSNTQPFYSYTGGVIRGSGALTTVLSANKRAVDADRWKKSMFFPTETTSSIAWDQIGPQWVYVTERGDIGVKSGTTETLKDTDLSTLKKAALKTSAGADTTARPAMGRFAYAIYDVGGLMDVNVAGNGLASTSIKGRKGRLHQANLAEMIGSTPASDLIAWRNPITGSSDTIDNDGLFDPERDFGGPIVKSVTQGGSETIRQEQVYLSRQDLIADFETRGLSQFLPHLTILSVEKNAPSWSAAALSNMKRRFALRALGRIGNTAAGPDEVTDDATLALIKSELGLVKTEFGGTNLWVYAPDGAETNAFGGIKELSAVTEREPTLFEVLKAAIPANSLGGPVTPAATSPAVALATPVFSTYTASGGYTVEQKQQDAHIFQIGVNMIDQYDTNSFPTDITVLMQSTEPRDPANRFFGVENLPYLSRVRAVFHAEQRDADPDSGTQAGVYLKAWLLPELMNPNGTALNGANFNGNDVKIRLRMTGSASVFVDDASGSSRQEGRTLTDTSSPVVPRYSIWHNGNVPAGAGEIELTAAQLGTGQSVWAPVAAAGSSEPGFFVMGGEYRVNVDGTKPDYTYSIESGNAGGNDPLTIILEYGLPDPSNPSSTIWRPYSIWNEIKTGTGSRLSVTAATTTGEIDTRTAANAPVWAKEDPRTERSTILFQDNSAVATAPTVANAFRLDEAFRGVGDLTAVFRDIPHQNLLTAETGNTFAGVLDFFSIDANDNVFGKIALNSRSKEALQAMFEGTVTSTFGASNSSQTFLDKNASKEFAEKLAIFNANTTAQGGVTPPIKNRVELAAWASAQSVGGFTSSPGRETTLRALGDVGNGRTWNLMIDVIAQSGRIPSTATGNSASASFIVEGERRYWIHLSLDRYTGEEVSSRIVEVVKE